MEPFFFLWILFALAAVGAMIWQLIARSRREKAIRAWAEGNGWTFEASDKKLDDNYRDVRPFNKGGGSCMCRHIIRGSHEDRRFVLFQYQYTVSNGKSSTTYYHPVLDMEAPIDGHRLSIQREHLGHKLVDAFGGEDIDFESAEFSKRFWVQCDDRRFAYDVITPAMMEHLMPRRMDFQWPGRHFIVHTSGHMTPKNGQELLDEAKAFLALLPRHRLATD